MRSLEDLDDLAIENDVETLQSDAVIVPMLQAIERALTTLEQAPTRRRLSLKRATERARAINSLVRRFEWLMLRYQEILDRPPSRATYEEEQRALEDLENRIAELVAEHGRPRG
jgi:DNA repair exonuclease SbcCD ATPase subunit